LDDPTVLEAHHVAGRVNSELTTWMCRNCHARASDRQEDAVPDLRVVDPDRGPLERQAAMLIGVVILLLLLAVSLSGWAAWNVACAAYLATELGARWWENVAAEEPK
jgi:hypothetical protein